MHIINRDYQTQITKMSKFTSVIMFSEYVHCFSKPLWFGLGHIRNEKTVDIQRLFSFYKCRGDRDLNPMPQFLIRYIFQKLRLKSQKSKLTVCLVQLKAIFTVIVKKSLLCREAVHN